MLGLATRHLSKNQVLFTTSDELDLIFRGFLIFFDPPKPDAPATIELLASLGVSTKLVTGDSLLVAKRLCQDCGIPADHCLTGGLSPFFRYFALRLNQIWFHVVWYKVWK